MLKSKIDDANSHVYTYDNLYQIIFVDYNDGNSTDFASALAAISEPDEAKKIYIDIIENTNIVWQTSIMLR